ncbi:hypothetical protein D3C76_1682240 [compost metagenome]
MQHILNLAAISTGVHIKRAAYCSRDAAGKFQARQLLLQRIGRGIDNFGAALGNQQSVLYSHLIQNRSIQHNSADSAVADNDIRTVTQHG